MIAQDRQNSVCISFDLAWQSCHLAVEPEPPKGPKPQTGVSSSDTSVAANRCDAQQLINVLLCVFVT